MEILLVLAGIACILFAITLILMRLHGRGVRRSAEAAGRMDPFAATEGLRALGLHGLAPGAVVSYGGVDHVVRGTLTLRQGPFVWWEHLLDGGSGARWLSVEEDEAVVRVALWTTRPDLSPAVTGGEPPESVLVEGATYIREESGEATYTSAGNTGLPHSGTMSYADYRSDQGGLLGLERWAEGMRWEASLGSPLGSSEYTIYPAPTEG